MSRRYDSRTTIFSPEGRLHQVEYAMEAISHAGAVVGIVGKDCVVMAAEKRVNSKLLDIGNKSDKMVRVDKHIACGVAGITSDANILIEKSRVISQEYLFRYGEAIPIESLVMRICDTKQGYTQFGGLRPFGTSFLMTGWDRHYGFQLYKTDPSGNYAGWKATAIGSNHQGATSILKQEYKEDMTKEACLELLLKVMTKTMDTTKLQADKLEIAVLTLAEANTLAFHLLRPSEIEALLPTSE